ncbi:hypothetical protein JTE90_004648 [Oedothorax gibbosus]|uniref:Uncharacterized protein n=1 Tax=Oedothorax gibbosus TaxID=931172 RepID=A0AAV6V001_9ARAC|nr:hypothetical protein JTE90_004648 [Oedothorax gibbosus]
MIRVPESTIDSEDAERTECIEHLEPYFQEAINKILFSHEQSKSVLNEVATERILCMRQQFDVASRLSSLNVSEDSEGTRFILNAMFDTISESVSEIDNFSEQAMRQSLDVASLSISCLSKKIRSSLRVQSRTRPANYSKKDVAMSMKLFVKICFLILIYVLFAVFSEELVDGYKEFNQQSLTVYQSA